MKQQILCLITESQSLRSIIVGWDNIQDPNLVIWGEPIGKAKSIPTNMYDCVLRAMADGWRLLGPPQRSVNECDHSVCFDWWMYRDVP